MNVKKESRRVLPARQRTKRRSVTMTDIAALAGVSQTTVSLVLNDALGARLTNQTRQLVLEAARELGYRRLNRREAVRPAANSAKVIGVMVDELSTDPWCAIALDGIRQKATEYGVAVSIAVTQGDRDLELIAHAQLRDLALFGLIYATIQTRRIRPASIFTYQPTILLNCHVADRSLPSVTPREILGGRTATDRLLRGGHTRIGLITGETWMDAMGDRLKGYRQALAAHEIPFDAELVRPGNWEPSAGYEQTYALMQLEKPPTAIFCANDLMALGCFDALKEMGKRIPEDVAVIGYDDREIAQFLRPALTTILLPHFDMGVLATEYLIDHAQRPRMRPAQIKVDCPLVDRASVNASPVSGGNRH
ncbi:LacI family DNA-binding transcriptional regulator [Dongia sp.]|uniref:LacI family DNA-binding transcriptional regulator n=1 Tax=Dongia sp. TaxID=1977262 RepID=UPI0035AF177A